MHLCGLFYAARRKRDKKHFTEAREERKGLAAELQSVEPSLRVAPTTIVSPDVFKFHPNLWGTTSLNSICNKIVSFVDYTCIEQIATEFVSTHEVVAGARGIVCTDTEIATHFICF